MKPRKAERPRLLRGTQQNHLENVTKVRPKKTILVDIYHCGSGMRVFTVIPEPVIKLDKTHKLVGRYNQAMDYFNFFVETTGLEILGKKLKNSNFELSKFSIHLGISIVPERKEQVYYRLNHGKYHIIHTYDWSEVKKKVKEYWNRGHK